MIINNDEWIINIKSELDRLGLGYIWYIDNLNGVNYYKIIEHRLLDVYKQSMLSEISRSSKAHLYQHLVDHFTLQYYLSKPLNPTCKKYIAQFRLSAHKLNIEKGRYTNENRRNRLCTLCNTNDIEDEFHFILKCPLYDRLRKQYIKKYYYNRPSVYKLIQLLSVQNIRELCNLGKFLSEANKLRSQVLSV